MPFLIVLRYNGITVQGVKPLNQVSDFTWNLLISAFCSMKYAIRWFTLSGYKPLG